VRDGLYHEMKALTSFALEVVSDQCSPDFNAEVH